MITALTVSGYFLFFTKEDKYNLIVYASSLGLKEKLAQLLQR